ncbi:hypothetical protein ILUMI_04015 [Ignelater luminosus]|uniref:Uncharacterized protein n=1 Tax=Ignelater luminosus TaxID=2038154 RepID=A0A8K0DKL7_IGNLU|nr:hypothetical protein ILUMI_04015 [Ignelater luminosus]
MQTTIQLDETNIIKQIEKQFPEHDETRWRDVNTENEEIRKISPEEITNAVRKKAPGPDGITTELVQATVEVIPERVANTMNSYFTTRRLITEAGRRHKLTIEVPRDSEIKLEGPDGVHISGYTDDLAIVVVGKTKEEIEHKANKRIAKMIDKLRELKLELASEKTEAIMFKGRRKIKNLTIQVGRRKMAIQVAAAYCSAPADVLLVITGMVPISLLADERIRIQNNKIKPEKREERRITERRWQEHRDSSEKGRWTHQMKQELMDGVPPGALSACHQSSWMQGKIFVKQIRHFTDHVKPTAEDLVLLFLDGHVSHTKNFEVISLTKEYHVVLNTMLSTTLRSSVAISLDVEFMAPLSAYYGQEIKVCKKVFSDVDFAASDVTERGLKVKLLILQDLMNTHKDCQTPPPGKSVAHETVNYEEAEMDDSLPGSSNSSFTVTPKDICPVPKRQRKETKRERGTSVVLMSISYKTELEANQNSSVQPAKRNVKLGLKRNFAKRQFSINKDSNRGEG